MCKPFFRKKFFAYNLQDDFSVRSRKISSWPSPPRRLLYRHVRQIFQLAWREYTLRVTPQTHSTLEYITKKNHDHKIEPSILISKGLDWVPKYHTLEPRSSVGRTLDWQITKVAGSIPTMVRQIFQLNCPVWMYTQSKGLFIWRRVTQLTELLALPGQTSTLFIRNRVTRHSYVNTL